MEQEYDLIVIGAGPGGYPAALFAAEKGKKVAVVEKEHLGGTCLNKGCIPTKTLLNSADIAAEYDNWDELGIIGEKPGISIEKLYQRKEKVTGMLRDGIATQFKKAKVESISGQAVIEGAGTVSVGDIKLKGKNILLAAGSCPQIPPIKGSDLPGVMTSDDILENNDEIWPRLLIIGGGVIGMEFAQLYSSLGSHVTVLEAMDRILPTMDKEIGQNLKMIMKKHQVEISTGAFVSEIIRKDSELICHYHVKSKNSGSEDIQEPECEIRADRILIATGRRPFMDGLFAPGVCPDMNGKFIKVNEKYETSIKGIYAVGDMTGGIQLAHAATAEGLNAVAAMLNMEPEKDISVIPACVYTSPEIACTGMGLEEAKEHGYNADVCKYITSLNGRSVLSMQERGFMKIVYDMDKGYILGAQLMCARATDIISEISLAITKKLTIEDLKRVIMPHPTFAEGIAEAASKNT